ncbi:MAG: ABC transporter substrate-binding protein [Burkholderiales bacterium]
MKRRLLLGAVLIATGFGVGAQTKAPIRIGAMFETSGNIASLGNQGYEGAQVVLDQINKAGGVLGRPIELVQINTESDETKSVTAVKRLIEREKVVALVGPHNSGSNFAITDTVLKAKLPMVTNGTSMQIAIPPREKPYIFMAQVTDATVIGVVIEHMKRQGISKVGLINADSAFAVSGREQWERLAPPAGIKIVIQETFGNSDQDMTPQLTKLRSSDADAVVIWAAGPGFAIAVKNYRQLGINKALYTSHGCVDPNLARLAGDAINGIVCASSKIAIWQHLPDSDPQKAGLKSFVDGFQAKFNRAPSMFAGNGADSLLLVTKAIEKAGGTDPQKIRNALEEMKNVVGLNYVFSYSPDNHMGIEAASLGLMTIKDQKFVPIAR